DQGWSLEFSERRGVRAWGPFAIAFRIRPWCSPQVVLHEPELLGSAIHADIVVGARMADERLEASGVGGEPIHHVTAVGASSRSRAVGVDKWVMSQRVICAFH